MIQNIKNFFNALFKRDFYTKDYNTELESYLERMRLDPLFFINEKFKNYKLTNNQKFIVDSFLNKNKVFVKTYNFSHVSQIQNLFLIWFLIYNPNINILVLFPNDNLLQDFISDIHILLKKLNIEYYPKYELSPNINNKILSSKTTLSIFNNSKLIVKTTKHKKNTIINEPKYDLVCFNQCLRSEYISDIYHSLIYDHKPSYFFIIELKEELNKNLLHNDFVRINISDDVNFTVE